MKHFSKIITVCSIFAFGYLAGTTNFLSSSKSQAQPNYGSGQSIKPEKKLRLDDLGLSKETLQKVRAAHDNLVSAREALKLDGKYVAATESINPFIILAGGGNAIEDLESGRGIDPDTFISLYSGKAVEEVKVHLGWDVEGRLTYKNKTVRLLPVRKIMQLEEKRKLIRESLIQNTLDDF